MIKIKDYIFNENEILAIHKDKMNGGIDFEYGNDKFKTFPDTSFDDIEWNYGTPQETQRKMQKELCKSCYYRDTISNKLKELEEEKNNMILEITKREEVMLNKEKEIAKLEEENKRLKISYNTIVQDNVYTLELEQKMNKAIEYIEKNTEYLDYEKGEVFECEGYKSNRVPIIRTSGLLEILGEENENKN